MNLAKWSLHKVQFLLSHIEEFIEDENAELRKLMANFEVQTGLEKVAAFGEPAAGPALPLQVLEKVAPFYEGGFLLQRIDSIWTLTDFFWRGQIFHLTYEDQIDASRIMREISPLQVERTRAATLVKEIGLDFLPIPKSADGYLFRPASDLGYVLISDLPQPWSPDHVESTHRLLNKSFTL